MIHATTSLKFVSSNATGSRDHHKIIGPENMAGLVDELPYIWWSISDKLMNHSWLFTPKTCTEPEVKHCEIICWFFQNKVISDQSQNEVEGPWWPMFAVTQPPE